MSAVSRARWCPRALSRTVIVGVTATAGIVVFAIPALAHITVTATSAVPGSAAVLTFHVPNEESNADTTEVDVQIPIDHPIAQFLSKPVPGRPCQASSSCSRWPGSGLDQHLPGCEDGDCLT
jgi:uncharacterized protein YcnI